MGCSTSRVQSKVLSMNLYKKLLIYSTGILLLTFSFPAVSVDFEKMDKVDITDIVFKRILIGAIDTTQEINSALGVKNLNGMKKAFIVVPAWFLTSQAVIRVADGLLDDVRWLTPKKRIQVEEFFETTKNYMSLEYDEAGIKNELAQLKEQIVNEQNYDPDVQFAREKVDQLQSNEAKEELKQAMDKVRQPYSASIKQLEDRLSDLTNNKNTFSKKFKTSLTNFRKTSLVYWIGRFINRVASTIIIIGFLAIEALILGDTVVIMFDAYEDMDLLKQYLIEDIEKTIRETTQIEE